MNFRALDGIKDYIGKKKEQSPSPSTMTKQNKTIIRNIAKNIT